MNITNKFRNLHNLIKVIYHSKIINVKYTQNNTKERGYEIMKNKGISLIVLIITIVVIIILATAIIVNLAQTNIIGNSNEAVVKQDFKAMQDELTLYIADKFADTKGTLDITTVDANTVDEVKKILKSSSKSKYIEYVRIVDGKLVFVEGIDNQVKEWADEAINSKGSTVITPSTPSTPTVPTTDTPVVAVDTVVTNANATITGEDFAYDNPVIPVGFKAVNTTKASWIDGNSDGKPDGWNNGLVIQDGSNNEYVWIPVDGTNVEYKKWNSSINTDYTVTKEQVEDDTLPSGVTSETEQITKYGGFYVARYEAGLPDDQTTEILMVNKIFSTADNNRTDIGKAQSKADKIVWNRIDYSNAKIVSENVVSTNYVQSGLITGIQWDTMLDFLSQEVEVGREINDDCTSWGNCKDKYEYTINGYYRTKHEDVVYTNGEYTKSGEGYLLLQTGKFGSVISEGSPKNLYDVAGNVWEWSTEIVKTKGGSNTAVGNKLIRGGSYIHLGSQSVASSRRGNNVATHTSQAIGFRLVLYIK